MVTSGGNLWSLFQGKPAATKLHYLYHFNTWWWNKNIWSGIAVASVQKKISWLLNEYGILSQ